MAKMTNLSVSCCVAYKTAFKQKIIRMLFQPSGNACYAGCIALIYCEELLSLTAGLSVLQEVLPYQ